MCPICMTPPKRKSESEVTQSSPTLCDPMDWSLPASVHGIFQARILEWVAISFNPCFKTVKANYWWLLKPAKFFFSFLPRLNFQFSSVAQLYLILCDRMNHSTPGLPVHHQLLESTQTHVHWVGDAIQPSYPLSSLFFLPSIFPRIRVFSDESALCIRWPKYWSYLKFSFCRYSHINS